MSNDNFNFYKGTFTLDKNFSLCKRKAFKIQIFLVIIGGKAKLIQILINLLYCCYNKFYRERYLLNFIYNVQAFYSLL